MNGWFPYPDFYFFTSGKAEGETHLTTFDACLLSSNVGNTNLVKLSSIIPPGCVEKEPVSLPYGAALPIAYAYISSDMPGEVISAAVAVALPSDPSKPGLIMEYSARGHKEDIERIVKRMAEEGMKNRAYEIKEIKTQSVEHRVERNGGAFAGVVLWNSSLVKH
ncbi:MAG: arginine decarboxylase, pyruvoyl-dependent [Myxococcota bacterium]